MSGEHKVADDEAAACIVDGDSCGHAVVATDRGDDGVVSGNIRAVLPMKTQERIATQ